MKKVSEKLLTIHEAREIIDEKHRERGEFNIYEQLLAEKYCDTFAKLPIETVEKLKNEIKEAIPRIPESLLIKIIDICPKTIEELYLLSKESTIVLSEGDAKKILEILEKYIK